MSVSLPSKIPSDLIGSPSYIGQVSRGQKYRHAGWLSILFGLLVLVVGSLAHLLSTEAQIWIGAGLALLIPLVNWTRIWVKESREPFKYTYSVAEFEPGPDSEPPGAATRDPIRWLARDLTEKLGDRVRRLSLLDDGDVHAHDPDQEPDPHVHVSGWYGLRQAEDDEWWLEVVPKVRVGGKGAPAELGNTVHFKLDCTGRAKRATASPPPLDARQYNLLVERVYWAVASKIYAQIRRGIEEKAVLLPPGRLRSAAYLNEAHDYARSNTLSAFKAARYLYRQACESYDRTSFERSRTAWREFSNGLRRDLDRDTRRLRRLLSRVIRQFGQREVRAAEARLGYARMLVAEWNLRFLCGSIPKELYEAPGHIDAAIDRLEKLPHDIPGRKRSLFRAYVTLALACADLQDPTGAETALLEATQLEPADAAEDADFLLAEAAVAGDPVRALRLLSRAAERDPKHERARFMKANQLEQLWRRQRDLERSPAEKVDSEYAEVIAIDPGNVSAWANRGYIGWLLSEANPGQERAAPGERSWRERAISYLDAGVRYKEVRRDAMVGELNWSLTRFHAEAGEFADGYESYLEAVSAMLGEPRIGFVDEFYKGAGTAMLKRYRAYEKRVEKMAEARSAEAPGEARMIGSVWAFVLNDCGGAHYAFHRRLGSPVTCRRAMSLFEKAIDVNPRFVLPRFNLAVVEGELAEDERLPALARLLYLKGALHRLREVHRMEEHWTFPRLRIAELEARLSRLQRTNGARAPKTRALSAHELLQSLLPHGCFRDSGRPGGRIDPDGEHVPDLLNSSSITWDRDFNEVQVEVLIHWVGVLAEQAPEKANQLGRKLQEVFYEAHPLLLEGRMRAAERLREQETDAEREQREEEIRDCKALQALFLFTELREDPAHFANLRRAFRILTPKQQSEIVDRVALVPPGAAIKTLLGELQRQNSGVT